MKVYPFPLLIFSALLVACTGTEEPLQNVRIALLTDGGKTLGYVDTSGNNVSAGPASSFKTVQTFANPNIPVGLQNFNTGSNAALTLPNTVEQLDTNLANPLSFGALPTPFSPCFTQSVLSAARDRLLALSDCNGTQQLALYRIDRTLLWTAILPTKPLPIPSTDTPPTRLAVLGDVAIVARASLAGQSEVIRAAPRNSGDPVLDQTAVVSDPLPTVSIRDLAPYRGTIYAATDTGVRPLLPTGVPDTSTATGSVTAFGNARIDRLWSSVAGAKTLLSAWRDNASSGNGSEPLRLWDGALNSAVTVGNFTNLRDVTFDLNNQMYTLTYSTLSRYDTLSGLTQNYWQAVNILGNLNDARALTWLVP